MHCFDVHTHTVWDDGQAHILSLDACTAPLPKPLGGGRLSVGLHPWHLTESNAGSALAWLAEIASLPAVVAIGEGGLDRRVKTPWPLQEAVFREQLRMADKLGKPMIVHCVRAHNELIRLVHLEKFTPPLIVHGFDSHPNIARQLLNKGYCLSFGKALCKPNSRALESLLICPLDRLFLETDAADISIGRVYQHAANGLSLPVETLQQAVETNFKRCFAR